MKAVLFTALPLLRELSQTDHFRQDIFLLLGRLYHEYICVPGFYFKI